MTMIKAKITRKEVWDVAENLFKNNESITLDRIRLEIGNKGSWSTISKYYKEWKMEKYDLPPPLHDLKGICWELQRKMREIVELIGEFERIDSRINLKKMRNK